MQCDPHGLRSTSFGPVLCQWLEEHEDCPGRWAYRQAPWPSDADVMAAWEHRRDLMGRTP